jgi:hypothetical protein
MPSREAQISAVAELDEPTPRLLYNCVLRQPGPVSRDEAAAALGCPAQPPGFIVTEWWISGYSTAATGV